MNNWQHLKNLTVNGKPLSSMKIFTPAYKKNGNVKTLATGSGDPKNRVTLDGCGAGGSTYPCLMLDGTDFLVFDGDGIFDENGKIHSEIKEYYLMFENAIKEALNGKRTYSEKSRSGTGFTILLCLEGVDGYATMNGATPFYLVPKHKRKKEENEHIPSIECFCASGHKILTGDKLNDVTEIITGEPAKQALYAFCDLIGRQKWADDKEIKVSELQKTYDNPDKDEILDALNSIPADLPYRDWFRVGATLFNLDFDFSVFDEWSASASNYGGTKTTWGCYKKSEQGCKAGTIFYLAYAHGWKPKKKKPADSTKLPVVGIKWISVSGIQESSPEWLIPNYIPKYQITTLSGDGGVGKSSTACAIAAAISAGIHCFLVPLIDQRTIEPQGPGRVLYFSSEDSFEYTLKRRLRMYGAKLENIITVPISDPSFARLKLGNPELTDLETSVAAIKPDLMILDPLQSFLDESINMGARNQMRAALNSLLGWGEKYHLTTLILSHTNKRQNASGRDRIADSADLWDISRSVLIAGIIKNGEGRYLSHEKSNYGKLQDTILYELKNERIEVSGYSQFKDSYYQAQRGVGNANNSPARDEAIDIIKEVLSDGKEMEVNELDEAVQNAGVSKTALRRAKKELKEAKVLIMRPESGGKNKKWYARLAEDGQVKA